MKSQAGFITMDFLFALVVTFGMSAVIFALTFTLSVVEVSQYIVFSAARAQSAAHLDKASQEKMARSKYSSLVSNPIFAPLYSNGWFTFSSSQELDLRQGDGKNFSSEYPPSAKANREVFQGARATLKANMLALKLPLLGTITPEDDGFSSRIVAILLREPSQTECQSFMEERKEQLWQVDGGKFSRFKKTGEIATPWEDNGC